MRARRALSNLALPAAAAGLMAALWVASVSGVSRGSRSVEDRRLSERALLAAALARPASQLLEAGRAEAQALAQAIGRASGPAAQPAIDAYTAGPRQFGEDVLVVDRRRLVVAASRNRAGEVGTALRGCPHLDGAPDEALAELAASSREGSPPRLSPLVEVRPDCRARVAAAAPVEGGAVIVLAPPATLASRLHSPDAELRVFLVDPRGRTLDPAASLATAPPYLAPLLEAAAAGPRALRYALGDAQAIGAAAPLPDRWALVVEQDAATFDLPPQSRPVAYVASTLTVAFGAVLLLLGALEARRRRDARRAAAATSTLFAIAGHELRTPLTALRGVAETLTARWDDLRDDQRRMLADRLLPQARRLARSIERLLTASALSAGTHIRPTPRPTALAGILEELAERFGPEAPLHRFRADAPQDLWAWADPAALAQALEHLVDNAVKYSPAGGEVWLRARRCGRVLEVAVEDEGVGLPAGGRRIFEAFVQGEEVDRRVHAEGGMGLGLYIVRSLVQAMGGSVRAEPRAPRGARFVVTLRAVRTPPQRTVTSPPGPGRTPRRSHGRPPQPAAS